MFKTYHLKIKNTDKIYFSRLFAEAKWFTNTIISSPDIFKFDTKSKEVYLTPEISGNVKWLSSQMRQELKDRMINNLKGLAARKKNGAKVGKLKCRKFVNSIPLKNQTLIVCRNRVRFQGYKKWFSVFGLNQLPPDFKIKSATLLRNALGLYLDLCLEIPNLPEESEIFEKAVIGINFGIKDSLTFDDGTSLNTDFTKIEKHIQKAHQELSRKQKGSANRRKAKTHLAKLYQRLINQKKDVTNKILNKLEPFKICYQDELLRNWHKGLFGKQVQQGILGLIKAGFNKNPNNVKLSRTTPTTQLCQNCRRLNKISLNERIYRCDCGYTKLRDKHSAQNMILIGLGQAVVEKELDIFAVLSGIESVHLSVKQEATAL